MPITTTNEGVLKRRIETRIMLNLMFDKRRRVKVRSSGKRSFGLRVQISKLAMTSTTQASTRFNWDAKHALSTSQRISTHWADQSGDFWHVYLCPKATLPERSAQSRMTFLHFLTTILRPWSSTQQQICMCWAASAPLGQKSTTLTNAR
jgi:hypothetical protein